MEVRIRLQRIGKSANKRYNYRVVAIGRNIARQGRNLEILGHYDPSKKPAVVSINKEKLEQWIKRGARMSDTVRSLVAKSR
jgi:small subunit ribosomal protein S16